MHPIARFALTLALAAVSTVAAFAADPGAPPAPQAKVSPGGVSYVMGGDGAESQAALKQMQGEFSLRIVYSAAGGEYAVPDNLTIDRGTATLLDVAPGGPIVMVQLQPGDYRVTTRVAGKPETRSVTVGAQPQTLNWKVAAG